VGFVACAVCCRWLFLHMPLFRVFQYEGLRPTAHLRGQDIAST
jgi:hypothetical protein